MEKNAKMIDHYKKKQGTYFVNGLNLKIVKKIVESEFVKTCDELIQGK